MVAVVAVPNALSERVSERRAVRKVSIYMKALSEWLSERPVMVVVAAKILIAKCAERVSE